MAASTSGEKFAWVTESILSREITDSSENAVRLGVDAAEASVAVRVSDAAIARASLRSPPCARLA